MSEKKYLDSDTAYNAGTLSDWYISSVDDSGPIWTDAHIDELVNDFYVIPKDTPVVDAAPVVHAHWIYLGGGLAKCSSCKWIFKDVYDQDNEDLFCRKCGAKMDESEETCN